MIVDALKDMPRFTILDIACGDGGVLNGVAEALPCEATGIDIKEFKEWSSIKPKTKQISFQDFIKEDKKFDVVMMLDTYRNWINHKYVDLQKAAADKVELDKWILKNAKYFITSFDEDPSFHGKQWRQIGTDDGHKLVIITI